MHTRLVEYPDGTFNLEWTDNGGKTWNKEVHRKLWVKKLAEAFVKNLYPKAKFLGTSKQQA